MQATSNKKKGFWQERITPSPDHFVLYLSLFIIICSFLMPFFHKTNEKGQLELKLFNIPIPYYCYFKLTTGIDCPGCGLVRSFSSMAKMDFRKAFEMNRMGVFLFFLTLIQIPWRFFFIVIYKKKNRFKDIGDVIIKYLFFMILAGLFINWFYNLFTGQAFR